MSAQESCRAAEEKLLKIQQTLGPKTMDQKTMDQSVAELQEIIAVLEAIAAAGPQTGRESFQRVQKAACTLKAHVEMAANFWSGLLQMKMGGGYTNQGQPLYFNTGSSSSFEG